ncbi:rhodanese-like domain-containing protein [Comamonas sp. NLF-1-9]|uniref:rhodanese-like domain-containing protein n=1 Tax=Comamonas sp. NLF-1-9 TaxID=2853163 RepID=UPI001C470A16|nr:rhodanese-like domain-containing protein [Comamonas sp. NLF-1-9]QXL83262.1 sulfurtransferase [Comamonas sp. NLF-1-9]
MVPQVRPRDLEAWLAARHDRKPVLLDVREPWELQRAHVAPRGLECISIPMAALPARLAELDKTRPLACLCHLGGRSMQVALYLQQQGFEDVANVAGGIHAWSLELDPDIPCY